MTQTTRQSARAVLPAWLGFAATVLLTAAAWAGGATLEDRVASIVQMSDLGSTRVGYAIVDVQTGRVLAEQNGDELFIPASNMKLLTSGAALLTLGDQFAFRTTFYYDETGGTGGTSRLIVRGSGDPALGDPILLAQSTPALDVDDLLGRITGAFRKRGYSGVDEIVIDDHIFDRQFVHPSWPRDQLNKWYCAEIGGVNFHTNVLTVYASASGAGQPTLSITPNAPWVELENRSHAVTKGRDTAWIARPRPANEFTVYGNVRSRTKVDVAIVDPPEFAGRTLASALLSDSFRIGAPDAQSRSPYQQVRLIGDEEKYENARPVAVVTTLLEDVLRRCNADSYNLYAEALIKRIGHEVTREPGSWTNGGAVIRMLIADRLGPEAAASIAIADGSGMSRSNRVTPVVLARWLGSMAADDATRRPYFASLPQPGQGTLAKRFVKNRPQNTIRAKSGYLRGVYTLSGFVTHEQSGHTIAFAILLNDVKQGTAARNAKPLHERIVTQIDRWLTDSQRTTADALGG